MKYQKTRKTRTMQIYLASTCITMFCSMQAQSEEATKEQVNNGHLEEVVVTARKRAESLQDTPIAITVMTSAALERRMITGTEQLDQVSPNLQFATYGAQTGNNSASQIYIRGIGQTNARAAVDPGVGLYIDDVYMGSSVGGVMDFRDIANVQILRGPQGSLFGRNTIGGAVLLTTVQPGDELGGTVKAGIGEDNLIELSGALDIPLTDQLKSRFTYGTRRREGYVFRDDGTDLGDENTYTLTGKLLWEPSDNFSLTLKADYTEEDENGAPLIFGGITEDAAFPSWASTVAGCPGATFLNVSADLVDTRCANNATWDQGPFTNSGTVQLESTVKNWGVAAIADWEVNEFWSIKSITSYRELDWTGIRDADNTPFLIVHTDIASTGQQFSQELQANYSSNALNGVFGAFYYEDEYKEDFVGVFTPPFSPAVSSTTDGILGNDNWALFGQFSYDFTEALSLTLGARYTEETKSAQLDSFQLLDVPGSVKVRNVDQNKHDAKFSNTSFSASVQYRWNDDFMTYASYSEGFKGGGWNADYNAPQANQLPTPFNAEIAKNKEIGFKADISGSLRINGAVFSTDYSDLQLTYRVGIVPTLFNAGKASIDGAELEFTYMPNERLIIEGSLGYLDAKIDAVSDIVGSTTSVRVGFALPYAPEFTGNIGIGYIFYLEGLELTPRFDYSYASSQFFDSGNTVAISQDSGEGLLSASLTLTNTDNTWKVVAGVTNLTDEVYPVAGNSSLTTGAGYGEIAYQRPRSWFLNLQYDF